MANLYSQEVKNLVSGVSQQPQRLRYPEQLAEQENGFSTEAAGLQKRPPTILVKNLGDILKDDVKPLVHLIDRDESEKYLLVMNGEDILPYDLEGNLKDVEYAEESRAYMQSDVPRQTLSLQTVADYTFFINKERRTRLAVDNTEDAWANQGLLVNVKSGQYGRTYQVIINGEVKGSYQTPDGSQSSHTTAIDTNNIINQLAASLRGNACIVKETGDSWLYVFPGTKGTGESLYQTAGVYSFVAPEGFNEILVSARSGGAGDPLPSGLVTNVEEYSDGGDTALEGLFNLKGALKGTGNNGAQSVTNQVYSVVAGTTLNVSVGKGGRTKAKRVDSTGASGFVRISWGVTATTLSSFSTKDGYNGNALKAFHKTAQRFTDLPSSAPDGFTVEITGEPGEKADNYYVRYKAERKVWEETVRPNLQNKIDTSTMPHSLVREADEVFRFKQVEWDSREIGDEDSNPVPSFINYPINDVFFHRARIGVLSRENVILTQSSNIFNFWQTTASEVLDTDPIDIPANHPERVCNLTHAVPFSEDLIVFADRAQFVLGAEGILSPLTAKMPPVTDYAFNPYASPVGMGRNIYFTSERHEYASVHEYYTMQNISEGKAAEDITAHVPSYIPKGVFGILSGVTENIFAVMTEGAEDKLFIYKYLFMEDTKVQSSWSYWSFGEDSKVLGGGFVGSTLYLLIQRPEGVCLEKMIFTYNTQDFEEEPYRVFLDRKIVVEPTEYNEDEDETTIDLLSAYDNYKPSEKIALVTSDGKYQEITPEEAQAGKIILQGDWRETKVVLGYRYLFRADLSEIMVKRMDESGRVKSDTEGRLQLRRGWVNYADTGYFEVLVEKFGKPSDSYVMTGRLLGVNAHLDKVQDVSGQFRFGLQAKSDTCKVSIRSASPLPLALIGYGWEGLIYRRSNPI